MKKHQENLFKKKKKAKQTREMIAERNLEHTKWKKNSDNYLSEYNPIPLQFL